MRLTSSEFEDRLLDALAGDADAPPDTPHLTERELRRLLRGSARIDEVERLGWHLTLCPECRASYDAARREEGGEMHRVRKSPRTLRILLRHVGVAAVVLLVVAATFVAGDRAPSRELLPATTGGARGVREPAASVPAARDLDAGLLVKSLHAFDGYPPHRAAAYTIGLLREYGVPLTSSAIAFRAATVCVVEPGDTWESIAAKALGDSALWPIVVLLNLELTKEGEFVPAGTYLRVPQPLSTEGAT